MPGTYNQIDIAVDQNASNILLGVVPNPNDYAWKMFFPDAAAPSKAGNLKRLGTQLMRIVKTKASHSATEPFVYYGMDTTTGWSLELDALQDMVTLDDVEQFLGNRQIAEQNAQAAVKIFLENRQEYDVSTALRTAASYSSGFTKDLTGVGEYKWSDTTSGNPVKDIEDGMQAVEDGIVGHKPNKCSMSTKTWRYLKNHPKMLAALGTMYKENRSNPVTIQEFASYFGFDEVKVSANKYNDIEIGDTSDNWTSFWGADFIMAYVDSNPQPNITNAKYSLGYDFYADYGVFKNFKAIVADSYMLDSPKGASVARVMKKHDIVIVTYDAGYCIKNCY